MAKKAVCVGINDYPGGYNDLRGCINDADDWADLLGNDYNFNTVKQLKNGEATMAAIKASLEDLVTGASDGDVLAFTYSGHGTWEYDNIDPDESDNRDEALCAHDGNILDDEIRKIIRKLETNAILTIISDSCHSGSVSRSRLMHERDVGVVRAADNVPKPRYMPPANDDVALRTFMIPVRRRVFYPETDMKEVLVTGCNALEYSYDAYINGRFNGAMTALSIELIKGNPGISYQEFHRKLRQLLPTTQYPQSPQLEGSDDNKNRALFT